jgi:hypothetical protein
VAESNADKIVEESSNSCLLGREVFSGEFCVTVISFQLGKSGVVKVVI